MENYELYPEEKLINAIFGAPVYIHDVEHFLSDEGKKAVNDLLENPPPSVGKRDVRVIRLRFGFEPLTETEKFKPHLSNARTLKEVGSYLGVTPERIRQVEAKTLRRFRHPAYSKKLKIYLEGRVDNV